MSGKKPDETQQQPEMDAESIPDELHFPDSELEQLREDNASLKERLLRAMAEMENLRKRSERERSDASKYAISNFARDMLSVGDNLKRAIQAISPEVREAAGEALGNLIEGVEMTEREMLNIFERHGIRQIEPLNERFDPNMHQAMFEVPNPDVPNSTVVQVVQDGYAIGDRVLRPAMVGVAKGGPKMAKADANATPELEETPDTPPEYNPPGGNIDKSA